MIIPIRCFTCNKVLASLYKTYLKKKEKRIKDKDNIIDHEKIITQDSVENMKIFKEIGITRYCCKRHMISHVDLIQKI